MNFGRLSTTFNVNSHALPQPRRYTFHKFESTCNGSLFVSYSIWPISEYRASLTLSTRHSNTKSCLLVPSTLLPPTWVMKPKLHQSNFVCNWFDCFSFIGVRHTALGMAHNLIDIICQPTYSNNKKKYRLKSTQTHGEVRTITPPMKSKAKRGELFFVFDWFIYLQLSFCWWTDSSVQWRRASWKVFKL